MSELARAVRSSPNKHDSDLIEKRVALGGGRCAAQREQARSLQVWRCYQVDGSSWLAFWNLTSSKKDTLIDSPDDCSMFGFRENAEVDIESF